MDNPKLKILETKDRGRGVFATAPIKKDELIAEWDGPIYTLDGTDWDNKNILNYVIQFEARRWRDSNGIAPRPQSFLRSELWH